MFIIFLRFSENKEKAQNYMSEHKAWIKQGMDEDLFLLVGSLQPNQGGCIIAHNIDRTALETRVNRDLFVAENIVTAEIHEITASMTNSNLQFLINQP